MQASANNSIVIGSTDATSNQLNNTISNSLMVGFNSNISTLFIGPSNGTNTYGKVGVGTSNPGDRFQIGDDYTSVSFGRSDVAALQYGTGYLGFNATRTNSGWQIKTDGAGNGGGVVYSTLHGKMIFSTIENTGATNKILTDQEIYSNAKMTIHPGGGVSIGTDCLPGPDFGLAVKGKIITEEVNVKLADNSGCWPDFVFSENYLRMNWREKNEYIKTNHHLPNISPASEIETNGLNVGETMAGITQNVEENTIDIIEIYKRLEKLENENNELKKEIEKLKEK